MCDFTCTKPEPTGHQTDESGLAIGRTVRLLAPFDQQLELPIGQSILVRIPRRQLLAVAFRPFIRVEVIRTQGDHGHPTGGGTRLGFAIEIDRGE